MKPANRSKTAEIPAIMRALHQTLDEEPKILQDAIVPGLIETTDRDQNWLAQFVNHPFAKRLRRWRAGFVMRDRSQALIPDQDVNLKGSTEGVRAATPPSSLDAWHSQMLNWGARLLLPPTFYELNIQRIISR
jgi:hypothetical protein